MTTILLLRFGRYLLIPALILVYTLGVGFAGYRWGLAGAEAILRLRALITCGDFTDYWYFHLNREHDRNHIARYQQHQTGYTLAA